MSDTMTIESVLEILSDDRDLLDALVEHGHLAAGADRFGPEEIETILVCKTLVRELEIGWPGVEVILRMRRQLLVAQHRLAEVTRDED